MIFPMLERTGQVWPPCRIYVDPLVLLHCQTRGTAAQRHLCSRPRTPRAWSSIIKFPFRREIRPCSFRLRENKRNPSLLGTACCHRHNPPLRHAWRARSVRCSNVAISVCVQAYKHASPGMGRQWLAGRVIQDVNVCCATFTGAADMAISPQSATTRSWLLAVAAGILLAGVTVLALNWHNERKDMVVLPVTGWPTQKPQRLGSPQVRHATVPHAYTDGSNQYDGNHHVSSRTNEQARLQPMPQPRAVEPAVALNVARPGAEDPVVFVTAVTREFVAHASCLVRSILKHVAQRASTGVHGNVRIIVFDLAGAHDALNAALKQNSQRVSIRPFNISKAEYVCC